MQEILEDSLVICLFCRAAITPAERQRVELAPTEIAVRGFRFWTCADEAACRDRIVKRAGARE